MLALKKNISSMLAIILCFLIHNVLFADPIGPNGDIVNEAKNLQNEISQWGTTFAASCVTITAILAVSSLILPWRFLKDHLGTPSWLGLAGALVLHIVLSYFGNSIHAHITTLMHCPLSILTISCR